MESKVIQVRLAGLRPLMFDRYAGDNTTQLPASEKMNLTPDRHLIMPSLNLYSMLTSEKDSVIKMFFGKQGRSIGLGIKSFTTIDPFDIPILDENGPIVFEKFGDRITLHHATARVSKGIQRVPMPKERPLLALPWALEFTVTYTDNKFCTLENLRQSFQMGGILGLGTFRPYFGRYELEKWE